MEVTIEITMYPLRADYEVQVINFLRLLGSHSELKIRTNAMSTQVQGTIDSTFNAIQSCIQSVYKDEVKAAFVLKILPNALDIDQNFSF